MKIKNWKKRSQITSKYILCCEKKNILKFCWLRVSLAGTANFLSDSSICKVLRITNENGNFNCAESVWCNERSVWYVCSIIEIIYFGPKTICAHFPIKWQRISFSNLLVDTCNLSTLWIVAFLTLLPFRSSHSASEKLVSLRERKRRKSQFFTWAYCAAFWATLLCIFSLLLQFRHTWFQFPKKLGKPDAIIDDHYPENIYSESDFFSSIVFLWIFSSLLFGAVKSPLNR